MDTKYPQNICKPYFYCVLVLQKTYLEIFTYKVIGGEKTFHTSKKAIFATLAEDSEPKNAPNLCAHKSPETTFKIGKTHLGPEPNRQLGPEPNRPNPR